MNFVHFSDTHLGGSNFKLREREQDFLDAFKQVIDYCLKEKPEFILHSGDLFDKGKPSNRILLFVIKQLKKLKQAGIPLFIVPGSHDVSVDGTFITILERVGLLRNVAKPENFEGPLMKGEECGDAIIYGVPGRRANIRQIYEAIKPRESDKFKIFMFHHITSDIMGTEEFADIPLSLLPQGMDYYAGGHWHDYESNTYQGKPVIYPGSTEYSDINVMQGKARGFIHYQDKPRFIKLETREVGVREIDCNNLNPEEITAKCIDNLKPSNQGLLILKLKGTLKEGKRNEVDTQVIKEQAQTKGYLYCNVRISGLNNPGEVSINTKKTIEDIEKEFLKKKGYSESEVMIARQLIELLGKDYKPQELIKAINKAGELV